MNASAWALVLALAALAAIPPLVYKHALGSRVHPSTIVGIVGVSFGVVSAAYLVAHADKHAESMRHGKATMVALLLVAALLGMFVPKLLTLHVLASHGVAAIATAVAITPCVVALASSALFGERLSLAQWAGFALVVGGVGLMAAGGAGAA